MKRQKIKLGVLFAVMVAAVVFAVYWLSVLHRLNRTTSSQMDSRGGVYELWVIDAKKETEHAIREKGRLRLGGFPEKMDYIPFSESRDAEIRDVLEIMHICVTTLKDCGCIYDLASALEEDYGILLGTNRVIISEAITLEDLALRYYGYKKLSSLIYYCNEEKLSGSVFVSKHLPIGVELEIPMFY